MSEPSTTTAAGPSPATPSGNSPNGSTGSSGGSTSSPHHDLANAIQPRRETVRNERDAFLRQAEQQLAMYNGAIAELERLLTPPDDIPQENEKQ